MEQEKNKITEDEAIDLAADKILEAYKKAFEELAK